MTPTAILALIRDTAIVGALGFILWWIHTADVNSVKVKDFQALQKQLQENAQNAAQYAQQAQEADKKRADDLATVSAAIGRQRDPIVLLRGPANTGSVSCPAAGTGGQSTGTGGASTGTREDTVDVRPAINGFENRIEQVVADCRAALAKWPTR